MAGGLRNAVVFLALGAGIAVTLPLQPGRVQDPAPRADAAAFSPRFEVGIRRDTLYLRGHTISAAHEDALARAAARHFPGMQIDTRFLPLGMAPDWWRDATVALTASLASLRSARARLTRDSLRIRGIDDDAAAGLPLRSLDAALPDSVDRDVHVAGHDSSIDAKTLCERRFAAFDHGPIGFEESRVELSTSALPVLDRVIALANACRGASISITGHTDASGNEDRNRQLSLERARAVAGYLGRRGIEPGRMIVHGAGSSQPVADNATRYGRGRNRRIELGLSY